MNDILKVIEALGNYILLKGVTKTIKHETEQKGVFLSMLLGTLGASLLGNLLIGKGILRAGSGRSLSPLKNNKGKGILRADSGNKGKEFYASDFKFYASD